MESKRNLIKKIYGERKKNARKYDYGLVIVIGGSKAYTGSPVLSALSALRSGTDIAQVVAPEKVANIASSFINLIAFPLEGDHLMPEHLPELLTLTRSGEDVSQGKIAVVIGGGIGRDEETKQTVRDYVKKVSVPIVIDADGIYAFEKCEKNIGVDFSDNRNIILTPHLYEFYTLTGKDVRNVTSSERGLIVKEEAKKISATILLKGETDFISDGDVLKENNINVPEMTVGGTGDVLAGITGSLLAKGLRPTDAGEAAIIINCLAGKLAAEEKGESLLATDIIEKIYKVIN